MTRFNNNNSNNNGSSASTITATTETTMVTTDVASSSSSTSSATTNIVTAATLATQSSSSTTIHSTTTMATTTTTTTAMMIERPPTVTLIGQPCGHHGSYTFYKAFKYCSTAHQLERVLMLGEFFFVRISPQDDPCIGELQLLWEDHQNHQLLSSTRLYFLPEQTPEGRLSHHGQHEVLAAQDKVILKLTDLVTWITHQVDWLAGMPYKWQPSTSTYCPSSSTSDDDDPPLSSTTTTSSSSSTIATLAGKKLNENKDNVPVVVVAVENNGDDEEKTMKTKEKKNSSEKQAVTQQQQWLQQRKMLSSLAFIHNQNVIPPNGSKPFLTSQRFINDKCKILFKTAPPRPPPTTTSKSTAPPTTSAAAQQNNGNTAINRNSNNIDEATTSVMDQPPPPPHHPARQPQPQRYCRSFTCSRVDFSDIIPSKLRSNELQDDLSSVVVLSYNKYCRYRNLLKRIEGKEKDYLSGQRMVQDVLIELGIPQQRNSNVNILFCRDTFNHEALINNDLNCEHLAPKLKGRKRKRPRLKTIRRASSPDSDSPEENGRLFSPRRTRRTTAASTLASNQMKQFLCDQRKKPKNIKNKTTTSNNNKTGKNQQRSNKNYNNDSSDQEDDKNCEDGGGGSAVMMVELNQNTSDENDDHHHQNNHDGGRMKLTQIDKENKPSNPTKNNGNMNGGNNNSHNNENGGGGQRAEGDDNTKNKTDSSSTVDANNNIDKYKEQEQQEEKDIIIVVDRKDVVAAPKGAATGGGGGGGESDSDWDWDFNGQDDGDNHDIKFNRKRFLKEFNKFMKQRKTPIKRVPYLGFKKIDLFQFYTQAQKFGGYEQLTKKRLWKKLYDKMGGDKHCTSAATSTRRQYEKLLLPFDRHLRGLPDIHRKRKRSEDFMEESDDVDGELSSNFSETDSSSSSTITTNSSSKDNDDSDTRSVKSRGEATKTKTEAKAEQPQPKVDPDVIVTTAPPGTNTNNTTMIKGIQFKSNMSFNQSCQLSECDEKMDVKVMENNNNNTNNNDVVVNHLAVGGLTPTVEEIDIKLIPITDSKNGECCKKREKDVKLFRDLSPASTTTTTTTSTTSARPSKTVPPNENILISVRSEENDKKQAKQPPPTKKDDQLNNNNNNKTTTKNINAVLPLLSNTNSHQNKMTALVHPTQRRCEVLNNNDATTTAAAGDVYDFTDLNPLEQQEQQKEELLLLKSFESSNKKQQQQLLQQKQALQNVVNPDNKSSRLKGGPSPFHSIANLVNNQNNNNNNDRLVVPVVPASPETAVVVKQAAKPTTVGGIIPLLPPIDDSHSSINNKNISGLDNNPPPTATATTISANAVKKKNILLQKSLENSAHHHHLHHPQPPTTTAGYRPPTPINNNSSGGGGGDLKLMDSKPRRMVVQCEPLPAHSYNILQARATTSFGTTTTKRKRFNNIATDEILDLSMKKRFHEADSRITTTTTTLNVNSFPVDNGGRLSTSTSNRQQQQQQSNNNNVRDGILLDLSTANNNSKKNNNNKLNSTTNSTTTKQQPKLPIITPKVSHQVFVQENPCSITAAAAVEPAGNLIWKKNPIQPPKDVVIQRPKRPSIISLEGEETMIVRPVDAPQKARSYKALPRQINKTKPSNKTAAAATNHCNSNNMNNNKTSVIQPIPSISEYNPSLPQFIGSHLWNNWNPFQMQTATPPTPFPSGVMPIIPPTTPPTTTIATATTNSVHHHHHTSPPPPQSSFNTAAAAVHSNIPASIMPQSILSSFPNYDTRSSSSSSSSLDRNSLAMLEQIRMLQACQLKNNFQMGQNPFFNPDLLANYNLANILASSISSAASSSSSSK